MKNNKRLSFSARAELCHNTISRNLFLLIEQKQTNLALSADVTKCDALLELAKASPDKLRRLTKKAKKQKRASITGGMGPGTLDELYDENSGLYDELTRMDLEG